MREGVVRIVLLIAMFVVSPARKEITLRIPLQPGQPEEIAVVTFDADRVSAEHVKKWMLLHENSYYHTPTVGYYHDCKPSDISKLEEDIKRTEQMVSDLDDNDYPKELTDVVRCVKALQSSWLWLAQQELAFLKSSQLPQTKYKGLDLRACQVSTDKPPTCSQIFHNWHNCANNELMKRIGSYPKEKWKAFLDSFGIQERLESTLGE
jgi:hypothetical protein